MSSFIDSYGYPYCLGGYTPFKLNRDPKWIKACGSPHLPVNVSMPHEFYLQFLKWANRQVKDWWRCQLMRGTFNADPYARHNRKPVPSYVKFFLSWVVAYDALRWSSAGIRWMCWEVFGSLGEECMKYVRDSFDSNPELSKKVKESKKLRVVARNALAEVVSAEATVGLPGFPLFPSGFIMHI